MQTPSQAPVQDKYISRNSIQAPKLARFVGPFSGPKYHPQKNRARRRFEKQYTGKLIAHKKWPAMWVQFPDPIITPTSINARTVGLQAFEADFGVGFRTHFSTLVRGALMSKSEG